MILLRLIATNFSWLLLHMKEKNFIVNGALLLGIGTLIAKILGAVYRIILTNQIGALGLGLYQMVFPVYTLLLDFSGAGLPSALSRLISGFEQDKDNKAKRLLKNSIKLFSIFGLFASLFMALFSFKIAKFQGNTNASLAYLFLSPAIFFVAIISCFRGYFQGYMNMVPTSVSQIIEQIIKLFAGFLLIRFFLPNIPLCVGGATLAITFSELITLIYLIILYRNKNKKLRFEGADSRDSFVLDSKKIISNTLPITLVGIMIPLSQVVDSFLTINIISKYSSNATTLYGLLSGACMSVINLPVSLCYGIATVAIPAISSVKDEKLKQNRSKKVITITVLIALPCSLLLTLFSPLVIKILFNRLSLSEKVVAIKLLKLTSPCVIFLSVLQASNAILIGKGKLYTPVITLLIGIIVKTVLNLILLNVQKINIYGGAISIIACYFTTCLINLILIFAKRVRNESIRVKGGQYAN